MKNLWVWVVIVLIVLGVGYYYKHQIKVLLMGSPASEATMMYASPSPASAMMGDVVNWENGTSGQYGAAENGMTLYTFDKDTKNVSNCTGSCAGIWPAYTSATTPASLPANVTLFKTASGTMQFAYMGKPLYYYSGDKAAGDMNGDGVGGVWHVLKP